jgi:hypothetical protein
MKGHFRVTLTVRNESEESGFIFHHFQVLPFSARGNGRWLKIERIRLVPCLMMYFCRRLGMEQDNLRESAQQISDRIVIDPDIGCPIKNETSDIAVGFLGYTGHSRISDVSTFSGFKPEKFRSFRGTF